MKSHSRGWRQIDHQDRGYVVTVIIGRTSLARISTTARPVWYGPILKLGKLESGMTDLS